MLLPELITSFLILLATNCVLELPQANAGFFSSSSSSSSSVPPASPDSTSIPASCYRPSGEDCSWYRNCLERKIPCEGRDGDYAIAYADDYCNRYQDNYASFSRQGQEWVDAAKKCLQLKLAPVLRESPAPSCPQVKARAFESHVPCYLKPSPTAPSFCDLSFWDKLIIFRTVWTALGSEFYETARGAFAVAARC